MAWFRERVLKKLPIRTFYLAVSMIVLKDYIAEAAICSGESMLPTIKERGVVILVEKPSIFFQKIQRGDVVVAVCPNDPNKLICKRVVALEHDVIMLYADSIFPSEFEIPQGHIWLEGDNKRKSNDSRHFGPIPYGLLRGRAVCKAGYSRWHNRFLPPRSNKIQAMPHSSLLASEADILNVTLKILSPKMEHCFRSIHLPAIIGRQVSKEQPPSKNNGIFKNSFMSRRHAELWNDASRILLQDLNSSNGTFVNGVSLKPMMPCELRDGDIVQFGTADENCDKDSVVVTQIIINIKATNDDTVARSISEYLPNQTIASSEKFGLRDQISELIRELSDISSRVDGPNDPPSNILVDAIHAFSDVLVSLKKDDTNDYHHVGRRIPESNEARLQQDYYLTIHYRPTVVECMRVIKVYEATFCVIIMVVFYAICLK